MPSQHAKVVDILSAYKYVLSVTLIVLVVITEG